MTKKLLQHESKKCCFKVRKKTLIAKLFLNFLLTLRLTQTFSQLTRLFRA